MHFIIAMSLREKKIFVWIISVRATRTIDAARAALVRFAFVRSAVDRAVGFRVVLVTLNHKNWPPKVYDYIQTKKVGVYKSYGKENGIYNFLNGR